MTTTEPRVFRNPPFQFILAILLLGLILASIFFNHAASDDYSDLIPFVAFLTIILIISFHSATVKTMISEEKISTQSLLGTKTLTWSEIHSVSGKGNAIKLYNFDGDIGVAPSPQLPGYGEVIEWIGIKRPDLFKPQEYSEMKRSWLALTPLILAMVMFIAILVGVGVFFLQSSERPGFLFAPVFFMLIPIAVFSVIIFSSPQSIMIDGKSLVVDFVFGRKSISADQIRSIELSHRQSRNGRKYFVMIRLGENKKVKISSSLNPSLPIAYLVLKNWHKQSLGNSLTNQPINSGT